MGPLLAQLTVNGVISGSMYMLLGLSWGIIYSTTGTFHFAHALVITVAAYAVVLTTNTAGLPLIAGCAAAIATAAVFGCLIEVGIYRPLRRAGASPFGVFVGSLGTLILGQNLVLLIFSANVHRIKGFSATNVTIGPVGFSSLHIVMMTLSPIVIVGVWVFLTRTRLGRALRAVASNPEMAETVGIDNNRITLLAYALGSGMAGLAAFLITLDGAASPAMGVAPVFSALIVTFTGGIGSIPGAVAGGLLLGLGENVSMAFIESSYKLMVSFLVLIAVIVVRPRGLFGKSS